jgi:hypothetical protein
MTRQLEAIRGACIKVNPEIEKREELYHPEGLGLSEPLHLFSKVRLADVLLAMKDINAEKIWAVDVSCGQFFGQSISGGSPIYHKTGIWNLRKDDLTEQSDECLTFLAELLN